MQHHKYSLSEIESLMPWERDIYVNLLTKYIKEENERRSREAERQTSNGRNQGCRTKTKD